MIEPNPHNDKAPVDRYLPWPVVGLFVGAMFAVLFNLDRQKEYGELYLLALVLSICLIDITVALIERFNRSAFAGGKIVEIRFRLVADSVCLVVFCLLLRAFPIPVWDIQPKMLLQFGYLLMIIASSFIAWLITRRTKDKSGN